ncbi:MAG: M23 family metallopeptidase [Coriobacteriia bacterium]
MKQQRPSHVDPAAVNPKLSTNSGTRRASGRQNVRDLNNFGEFGRRDAQEHRSEPKRRSDTARQRSSSRKSDSSSIYLPVERSADQRSRKKSSPSSRSRYKERPAPEYDAGQIRRLPRQSAEVPRGASALAPVRDTGLAVRRGVDRQRDAQRKRTLRTGAFVVILVVVVLGGFTLWRAMSDRAVEGEKVVSLASLQTANSAAASTKAAAAPVQDPTPIFATYGDLSFRLPVAVSTLTEVLFHQASYSYALHLATPMPIADLASAANKAGTHRDISAQPKGDDAVLVGSVLQVWRSGRSGKPDTAVDVGAEAGSDVYAPLSGTVVKVKPYLLYGKYDDIEVHIQPTGHPELDLVLIHVDGITVTPGTQVTAGVTKIGTIRLLSNRLKDQLADYSPGSGDHVHVQLNDAHNANYKGLEGAITVTETAGSQ